MESLSPRSTRAFRAWLFYMAASAIATVLCILYVDRPLAEFLDSHVRHTAAFHVLNVGLHPVSMTAPLSLLFLLVAGGWALSGYGPRPWAAKPVVCALALAWGLASEFVFKRVFGRSWPDPTYLHQHLYGFHLLHGSDHWSSFPSGTAIGAAALATAVSLLWPRLRFLCILLGLACSAALVIDNFHWLSDVIAGCFLGVSIGWMSVLMIRIDVLSAGRPSHGNRHA